MKKLNQRLMKAELIAQNLVKKIPGTLKYRDHAAYPQVWSERTNRIPEQW